MDYKNFGRNVREIRTLESMSIPELAKQSGVNSSTLASIENGKFKNVLDAIDRLSTFLCVSIDDLMYKKPKKRITWE